MQKWGPWAGRIISGDEQEHLIYAIGTNGVATAYALGIDPEDFDIIQTNQDLYCVDTAQSGTILKVSRTLLTDFVGDLLVTQAGETTSPLLGSRLFVVHWDGTTTNIVTRCISLPASFGGHFEHVTFAPMETP